MGKFAPSPGMASCAVCPAGRYGNAVVAQSCVECGLGKYSTATQAVAETTCVTCPSGRFTPATGGISIGSCEGCPVGKYSLVNAGEGCMDCPRGRFTSSKLDAQMNNCTLCDRNTYTDVVGSTWCLECASSKFSHYGYGECVDCDTTALSSGAKPVDEQMGSLQNFWVESEELSLWKLDREQDSIGKAATSSSSGGSGGGIVAGITETLTTLPQNVGPTFLSFTNFERSMPLVLRGFARAENVKMSHGGGSEGNDERKISLVLRMSLDEVGDVFEEVMVMPLFLSERSADAAWNSSGWEYLYAEFVPTPRQIAKRVQVELHFEGAEGLVEWGGLGLYIHPAFGCGCDDGSYMNMDTPDCRVCEVSERSERSERALRKTRNIYEPQLN